MGDAEAQGGTHQTEAETPVESRSSSRPAFWDERYARAGRLFGTEPSAFVASVAAERLPGGADVIELGAGEARNLVYLAQAHGCRGTAVDFAGAGLRKARAWAEAEGVALRVIEADVRTWRPGGEETWDAALVTFLHLLPRERPALYRLLQQLLRPGGLVLAEWFAKRHLQGGYARIGPSKADRLITPAELRRHFASGKIHRCDEADVTLDEGAVLQGRAAVVRLVWQKGG